MMTVQNGAFTIPNYVGPIPNRAFFAKQLFTAGAITKLESEILDRFDRVEGLSTSKDTVSAVKDTATLRRRIEFVKPQVEEILGMKVENPVYAYHNTDIHEVGIAEMMALAGIESDMLRMFLTHIAPASLVEEYFHQVGENIGSLYESINLSTIAWRKINDLGGTQTVSENGSHIITIGGDKSDTHIDLTLAHELAHTLQMESGYRDPKSEIRPLLEGHARGVEFIMASSLFATNPDYLSNILRRHVHSLSAAYALACYKTETVRNPTIDKFISDFGGNMFTNPDHELGLALFVLAEMRHGPDIYHHTLGGNLEFLDLAA